VVAVAIVVVVVVAVVVVIAVCKACPGTGCDECKNGIIKNNVNINRVSFFVSIFFIV